MFAGQAVEPAAGEHRDPVLLSNVTAFAAAAGAEVEFERVAVTPEQILAYELPTAPPKITDHRSFDGIETTQAEALPPDLLATLVREAIRGHRDPKIGRLVLARERLHRQELARRINR